MIRHLSDSAHIFRAHLVTAWQVAEEIADEHLRHSHHSRLVAMRKRLEQKQENRNGPTLNALACRETRRNGRRTFMRWTLRSKPRSEGDIASTVYEDVLTKLTASGNFTSLLEVEKLWTYYAIRQTPAESWCDAAISGSIPKKLLEEQFGSIERKLLEDKSRARHDDEPDADPPYTGRDLIKWLLEPEDQEVPLVPDSLPAIECTHAQLQVLEGGSNPYDNHATYWIFESDPSLSNVTPIHHLSNRHRIKRVVDSETA